MSRETETKIIKASQHIQKKEYQKARDILEPMSDPSARRLLSQLPVAHNDYGCLKAVRTMMSGFGWLVVTLGSLGGIGMTGDDFLLGGMVIFASLTSGIFIFAFSGLIEVFLEMLSHLREQTSLLRNSRRRQPTRKTKDN